MDYSECDWVLINRTGDGVAELVMNRDKQHNALNAAMVQMILAALDELEQDNSIRVILLKSYAQQFCAGADLSDMQASANRTKAENEKEAMDLAQLWTRLAQCPKPTIAVVNGVCYGGGVGLVACCDIGLAYDDAKFCLSEVKLGLIPAMISPYLLRIIGYRQLQRFILTAEIFSAYEAKTMGLVQVAGSKVSVESELETIIGRILCNGRQALSKAKELLEHVQYRRIDNELQTELAMLISQIRTSEEAQEGMSAFLEKRPPKW